jgi:hypothetical protein
VVQISEKTSPAPARKRANRGLFIWSAALFILAVLCVLGPLALSVAARGSVQTSVGWGVPIFNPQLNC